MSTHALRTSEVGALRQLDLLALALGLPVFVAAGLPLLGWGAVTAAWLAARGIQALAERRALRRSDRRAAMAARAVALVARLYAIGAVVFVAGLVDRDTGVAAGLFAVAVFTLWFAAQFLGRERA